MVGLARIEGASSCIAEYRQAPPSVLYHHADGGPRAYRSTENIVDPAWTGRPPASLIDAVRAARLVFDRERGTGVVLHMLACLAVDGRFGATAIGHTPEHADELFEELLTAVT